MERCVGRASVFEDATLCLYDVASRRSAVAYSGKCEKLNDKKV